MQREANTSHKHPLMVTNVPKTRLWEDVLASLGEVEVHGIIVVLEEELSATV